MAFKYGFYNAINHDRVYSSEDFGQMFDGLITDGVYPSIGACFAVRSGGDRLGVIVRPGRAWFNRTWSYNSSDYYVVLEPANFILPRIDTIVLEIDKRIDSRKNSIKAISGEPAVVPVKPKLNTVEEVYQYPLAYIHVEPNDGAIDDGDIENAVGKDTPFTAVVLESVSIAELWAQWEYQFFEWLHSLKVAMSGDAAANLLGMIELLKDDKVETKDIASQSEAEAGTVNNKWMSPLRTQNHFDARAASDAEVKALDDINHYVKPNQLGMIPSAALLSIIGNKFKSIALTSGTSWKIPDDARGKVLYVTMCGGGGGGGGGVASGKVARPQLGGGAASVPASGGGGGGGAPGETVIFACIPSSTTVSYKIGAGGEGGGSGSNGGDGEETQFNGVSAGGGGGGKSGEPSDPIVAIDSKPGKYGTTKFANHLHKDGIMLFFTACSASQKPGGADGKYGGVKDYYNSFLNYGVGAEGSAGDIYTVLGSSGGGGAGNPELSVGGGGGGGGGSIFANGGNGGTSTNENASIGVGINGSKGSGGGGGAGAISTEGTLGGEGGKGGDGYILIQYQG